VDQEAYDTYSENGGKGEMREARKASPGSSKQPGRKLESTEAIKEKNIIELGLCKSEPESERQILGAVLEKSELIEALMNLPTDTFYTEKNQRLFSLLTSMHKKGIPITLDTVDEEAIKARSEIDPLYTSDLVRHTKATVAEVFEYYLKQVKEAHRKREIAKALYRILELSVNGGTLDTIQEMINRLNETGLTHEFKLKPIAAPDLPTGKQIDSIWADLLYHGCISQFNSEPGVGKTTLIYNLCARGVKGMDFLGVPFSKEIKVLYIDLETVKWLRRLKLERICEGGLPVNFHFLDGLDFLKDFDNLLRLCESEKYDVVVFDTQSRVLALEDENDNSMANQALVLMRKLTSETNCALILIHHLGKSENQKSVYRGRGASAIAAGVDVVINLEALDEDIIKITTGKNRITAINPVLYVRKIGDDRFEPYTHPGEQSGYAIFKCQRDILALDPERIWETGELKKALPYSEATIERATRKLFESGKLSREGRGKYKINKINELHHEPSKHQKHHPYIDDASDAFEKEVNEIEIPELIV
jgi:hypothetical protein